MTKVSVIVPVCNVEQYIDKCIDSIIAQTLEDIEIICVDDGSTDSSPIILDGFANRDSRVKVIHQANAGYGAAINTGIDAACGEYIGIVESDDCILPNMYERLYEAADSNELDLVKSDAYYWLEKYDYTSRIHIKALDEYYDRVLSETDREVLYQFYMNTWTGIYRKSFLDKNNIRHHESPGASYQDNGFWMLTLSLCERAMWLNDAFYLYRQDNPMASVKNPGKVYTMMHEYDWVREELIRRERTDVLKYCEHYRLLRHRGTFLRIAPELRREFCEEVIRDYNNTQYEHSFNSEHKQWYDMLIKDADELCDKYDRMSREIYRTLGEADSIVIYGAGIWGNIAFRQLVNMGHYDKIKYFAVSCAETETEVGMIPVVEYDRIKKDINNSCIVLAVSSKSNAYNQIHNQLTKDGIGNILGTETICEYIYIV